MKIIKYIFCAILFVGVAVADTINIDWIDGSTTYAQTTCEIGGDLILRTSPTKRGYTFVGWSPSYTLIKPDNEMLWPAILKGYKKVSFSGTENWTEEGTTYVLLTDLSMFDSTINDPVTQFCNTLFYEYTQTSANIGNKEFYFWINGNKIRIKDSQYVTLNNFKGKLSKNEIIFLIKLEESDGSVWMAAQYNALPDTFGYLNLATGDFVKVYGMTGQLLND